MNQVSRENSVRALLKSGIAQLRSAHVPSFTLAAELLLLHVLGRDRTWLYAHPEESVSEATAEKFQALIARRAAGEPTQYLTGKQEFWGLEFEVTPDVLIPRPETEHLMEVALDRLALREIRAGRTQTTSGEGFLIADIGTGSGCLAIALAKELTGATVYATDISRGALVLARRNAEHHGVAERMQFVMCNLLEGITSVGARCILSLGEKTASVGMHESPVSSHEPARGGESPVFDLIFSNPPYVGRRETETLPIEVRKHEPESALYGGEEGYELYAELVSQAAQNLIPGGILVLELGHNSLPAVRPLLDAPAWANVSVTNDLAGIPRVIAAERSAALL
jgi:release factor glutamine methyltransferase